MNLHAIAHRVAISARQVVARSIWWPRQPVAAHVRGVPRNRFFKQFVRADPWTPACLPSSMNSRCVRGRS